MSVETEKWEFEFEGQRYVAHGTWAINWIKKMLKGKPKAVRTALKRWDGTLISKVG